MWAPASALLLLLPACCLWSAEAQRTKSIWDDPIQFKTKRQDLCTMTITGQGEYTRLRLSCQGAKSSYWCDYVGKPHTCRPYNKNPRHYFVQMMWGLRKLNNACQAPRQIKPHMCRHAGDDSQMVFSSASVSRSRPDAASRTGERPASRPARPQPTRLHPAGQTVAPSVRTTRRAGPQPTTAPAESYARRTARRYCWRSLQGICSYLIGLFRN